MIPKSRFQFHKTQIVPIKKRMTTVTTRQTFAVPDIQVAEDSNPAPRAQPVSRSTARTTVTRPAAATPAPVPTLTPQLSKTVSVKKEEKSAETAPAMTAGLAKTLPIQKTEKSAETAPVITAGLAKTLPIQQKEERSMEDYETEDWGAMEVSTGVFVNGTGKSKGKLVPKWTNEIECHAIHLTPKSGSGRMVMLCQPDSENGTMDAVDDGYTGSTMADGSPIYTEGKTMKLGDRCMMLLVQIEDDEDADDDLNEDDLNEDDLNEEEDAF
jgi:hypothetical protein